MFYYLVRWFVLVFSLAASVWLLSHVTFFNWFAVLAVITIGWSIHTILIKGVMKWSLINYILTPVLLWVAALSLLIFAVKGWQQYMIIIVATLLSGVWSTTLHYYLKGEEWLIFRGNLLSYINSFIVFFASSSMYAAVILIFFPRWIAVLIMFVISFALHIHIILASHVAWRRALPYSFISAFLLMEFFMVLMLWPISFWVNGLLITSGFYILSGLSRCALTSVLTRSLVHRYLLWGGLIIFVILITAP